MLGKFSTFGFIISLLLAIQFGIDMLSAVIISFPPKKYPYLSYNLSLWQVTSRAIFFYIYRNFYLEHQDSNNLFKEHIYRY